jgi:hypothetical protein
MVSCAFANTQKSDHNGLTRLPPEIAKLVNLRDLNVSFNKLEYLPSELTKMRLSLLNVMSNPFRRREHVARDVVSVFPSLTELCLRVLLSPSRRFPGRTTLEEMFVLPLPDGRYPPSLVEILSVCVPGAVSRPHAFVRKPPIITHTTITGTGTCQSPRHNYQHVTSVFAHHAEEGIVWTRDVAGVRLPEEVPVQWRGCMPGCLNFLEDDVINSDLGPVELDGDHGLNFGGKASHTASATPNCVRRVQFESLEYEFSDSGDEV